MSTDPDINAPCPIASAIQVFVDTAPEVGDVSENESCKKKKKSRNVSFPDEDQIVTQYFEPANPWQDVPTTTRAQLAAEYLEACRRHDTPPIDSVLQQIRELPEGAIGGSTRAPRLTLSSCILRGSAPADALEAVLRKVQFRRLEVDRADIDDEGAEALFDMIEYYESAVVVSICGERHFAIRGWQAASRMIKKSAELSELEVSESALEASHAPVLARALRPLTCRLRALCLQRASLAGEPLLSLVIALKSNNSVRELRLGDNRLSPSDAAQIASLLKLNTRIQLLDLSNNQIQDAGVGHIADALSEQAAATPPSAAASPASPVSPVSPHRCPMTGAYEVRGLAFLVLWNNQLTRNCATHLSKALRSSTSLCVLNIGRNALGTESVRALCAGGALVSVGLQAARLGPDAAPALAELLLHDTKLQRLDLRDNRLGASGLQTILSALKQNSTITQVDLDDPPDSSSTLTAEDGEAAISARLTREIRALCARNEPAGTERRVHRKISLTCHTACMPKPCAEEERRGRLRSPAPSPAGSPVPGAHHSRFSVTRVTPERESSSESPTTPTRAYAPSRFKVVQVSEPPQIQVHPVSTPRKSSSRFSVTRNYDSVYNPAPPSPAPQDRPDTPGPGEIRPVSPGPGELRPVSPGPGELRPATPGIGDIRPATPMPVDIRSVSPGAMDIRPATPLPAELRPAAPGPGALRPATPMARPETPDTRPVTPDLRPVTPDLRPEVTDIKIVGPVDNKPESKKTAPERTESNSFKSVHSDPLEPKTGPSDSESDIKDVLDAKNINNSESIIQSDSSKNDVVSTVCLDKSEQLSHTETVVGDNKKKETKIVKNTTEVSETEMVNVQVEVTVTKENIEHKVFDFKNIDEAPKHDSMKQIVAITEDLGNLIQEFKDMSTKSVKKVKNDCTQTEVVNLDTYNVPVNIIRDNVVLKKNKSESSLDSPDLEVSRLMNKKLGGSPFCDSSSSLEISGSSVESLNTLDNTQTQMVKPIIIESDTELDRRKTEHVALSTESSIESNTSEATPVNSNFLNMSVSSNESVSPIIFGKSKKIHDSLSSLEASVSSLDSGRHEKVMVTSADSGIEYSLQQPSEIKDDNSSNEGTLTNNSSLKETVKKESFQDPTSPKRTASLLDVPALKSKGLERMRKISWVAPSPSFHIPKPEPEKEIKLPSHLEKLLSLFQHPLFSRSSTEEEKKGTNTPPRKDSSLTSSFWSWGSATEKEKEDRDSSSETTDSTLSERVQVSFVDESFSKKLDSKTPSTDTDNTLSEFQTFPQNSETSESQERVTEASTFDNVVQKCLVVSKVDSASSNGNKDAPRTSDNTDLMKPNDLNKNYDANPSGDTNMNSEDEKEKSEEVKPEVVRPRSFAAVLKSSGSENSLDKQHSPDSGQSVDKLPSKVIRGIKENISPENTLTSSMTNTKTLALELSERQVKNQQIVSTVWDVTAPILEKIEPKSDDVKNQTDVKVQTENLAPIATIEEACDETDTIALDYIDDPKFDDKNTSADSGVTSLEGGNDDKKNEKTIHSLTTELEHIDLGKDALSYHTYENQEFELKKSDVNPPQGSLAQELQDAEIKEMLDLSPELIIDDAIEVPEVFTVKEIKGLKTSPVIPERAKLKKSNSLEDLSQEKECPKAKTIAFKVPEISTTIPRDIPERRSRFRTRSGSSPKSLPESLYKPCPLSKMDSILSKKKKKVSSLGKMAKDSLLALNMSEEEIAEFHRSYKLTSVESLKSLESVSEDANSQSGNSVESRCKSCLRTSQESLMSLDSITEDCRCTDDCEKPGQSNR